MTLSLPLLLFPGETLGWSPPTQAISRGQKQESPGSSLVAQWVKDLVLLLLWLGFDPWPRNLCMLPEPPLLKKKRSRRIHTQRVLRAKAKVPELPSSALSLVILSKENPTKCQENTGGS